MKYKIKFTIERIKWWFKHKFAPKYQYNIIRTGLPVGYYDPDVRLIFANFNEFSKWYEISYMSQYDDEVAMTAAYNWWKENKKDFFNSYEVYNMSSDFHKAMKIHLHTIIENISLIWY